ncbi:2-dehydropantoate 2-reductase [Solibacillus sp. FSL R7-0682]|uniref:ketopantoate reductase family protein n=1 Tax=Solibacillus sp. FSL R7-0682 TaxID=2921690 RepID=UPI0030FBDEA0
MRIDIIGAGAVGLLLASFMAEGDTKVRLITKEETVTQPYDMMQLTRTNVDNTLAKFQVERTTSLCDEADLIIIAVKYGQLQGIYQQLMNIDPTIPLLFIQNGLAHYEEVRQLKQHHIAFSSIQFGAQKLSHNHVAHKGLGVMKIAVAKGEVDKFFIFKKLSTECFPIEFELDAEKMLMEKALLNCFINPLTAILQVTNGQLVEQNYAFQLLKNLYNEIITTFPSYAKTFQFEQVVALCERTAQNTSSMLADRLAGRQTEIDTIAKPIIKKAQAQNRQMPVLQTLYMLVKAFEESGEKM